MQKVIDDLLYEQPDIVCLQASWLSSAQEIMGHDVRLIPIAVREVTPEAYDMLSR